MNDTDRILDKLEDLEKRMVALQVQVATLEARLEAPKASLVRDGTITVSGGAFGALVAAVLAHFAKG